MSFSCARIPHVVWDDFLKNDPLFKKLWAVFETASSPDGCEGIPHSWSHSNFSLDTAPCVSLFRWKIHKYLWPFTLLNSIYAYFHLWSFVYLNCLVYCSHPAMQQIFTEQEPGAVGGKALRSKAAECRDSVWAWVQIPAPPATRRGALGNLFNLSSVEMRIILLLICYEMLKQQKNY